MDELRRLNASGALRAQPEHRWRGFCVNGRPTPGVASTLKRLRLGGDTATRLRVFAPGEGSQCRLLRSNTKAGVAIHARICDVLRRRLLPSPRDYTSTCARAAAMFCQHAGLRLEDAELVVRHPDLPLATRFDALCVDRAGRRELLSWKTGCGPRHAADLLQHKAQLALEWHMLERGHGVPVRRATLLYVGALQHVHTRAMAPIYQGYDVRRAEADELVGRVQALLEKRRVAKKGRRRRASAH